MGAPVEREVVRALMFLRLKTLASRPHRHPARSSPRRWPRCSTPASRRSCTSTARSAAAATSRRCRTARSCSWARARAVGPRRRRATPCRICSPRPASTPVELAGEGGPRPHQRHRRHARHAHHGDRRPRAAVRRRRRHRRDERRGAARHRPRVPPDLHEPLRPHPGQARQRRAHARASLAGSGDRRVAPRGRRPRAGRLLAALRAAGRRRRARHDHPCAPRRRARARGRRSTTPSSCPTARSSSQRQLPRRPRRPTCSTSSPSSPPTSARSPSAAPTACSTRTRSHGLPPFLADDPGVDSGLMIAQYTQAALVSENKRLAVPASVDSIPSSAMQEDHVSMGWSGGAQAAPGGRQPAPHPRRRARRVGARHRPAGAAGAGARDRRRSSPALRETRAGPRHRPLPGSRAGRRPRPRVAADRRLEGSGEP